jgi:hypothetical protein
MQHGKKIVFQQMRIQTLSDLEVAKEKGDKLLSEYLKARYYYYSNRAGIRLLPGEGDFGYVDEQEVAAFSAGKGPTSLKQEYDEYRRRIGK